MFSVVAASAVFIRRIDLDCLWGHKRVVLSAPQEEEEEEEDEDEEEEEEEEDDEDAEEGGRTVLINPAVSLSVPSCNSLYLLSQPTRVTSTRMTP